MAKKSTKKIYQSAVSGKFVSKKYAQNHPNTTFTQTVKKGK
jgi:hypothetical protein